jgi:hypothetical protein
MGYYYKIMVYGCAYVFAPHLVQIKWNHCHTIEWEIRVRSAMAKTQLPKHIQLENQQ